jgi:hypothetical protein
MFVQFRISTKLKPNLETQDLKTQTAKMGVTNNNEGEVNIHHLKLVLSLQTSMQCCVTGAT